MTSATFANRKNEIAARRLKVIEIAAGLFVQKGFDATSIEDIARGLKISKANIYSYMRNKDDILFQLHDHALQLLIDGLAEIVAADDPPDLKLRKAIVSQMVIACTEMSVSAAMLQMEYALKDESKKKVIEKRDRYESMFRGLIQEGIEQGIFVNCDVAIVSFFIFGAMNYAPHWYKKDGRLSKEEVAHTFADLLLDAIRNGELRRGERRCGERRSSQEITKLELVEAYVEDDDVSAIDAFWRVKLENRRTDSAARLMGYAFLIHHLGWGGIKEITTKQSVRQVRKELDHFGIDPERLSFQKGQVPVNRTSSIRES